MQKSIGIIRHLGSISEKKHVTKEHLLSRKPRKDMERIYPNAHCSDATKSESGETRIHFSTIEELMSYEKLYLESYKETVTSLEHYRKYVRNAQQDIKEYLSL